MKNRRPARTRALAIVLMAVVPGCAAVASPASEPALPQARLPNALHWFRNSAEYRAIARQTFAFAEDRLRDEVAGRAPGTWAVILDGDETVLDNSEYQGRLALAGTAYASGTWRAWVREERAAAIPGAREFLITVASLGGRIAIVTNRDDEVCDPTRANLRALAIPFDVVLCRVDGRSDKSPRVAAWTAAPGLPNLEVVLWVGDNIQDFPRLNQEIRREGDAAFDPFGRQYIVLPNPVYGSWENNQPL